MLHITWPYKLLHVTRCHTMPHITWPYTLLHVTRRHTMFQLTVRHLRRLQTSQLTRHYYFCEEPQRFLLQDVIIYYLRRRNTVRDIITQLRRRKSLYNLVKLHTFSVDKRYTIHRHTYSTNKVNYSLRYLIVSAIA